MSRRSLRHAILLFALASPALAVAQTPSPSGAPKPAFVVFFPRWSGDLDDAANGVIRQAAAAAKQNPSAHVVVNGYADSEGSAAANEDLSRLRAQRVVDGLVADGVSADRITQNGKGEQPVRGLVSRRAVIRVEQAS